MIKCYLTGPRQGYTGELGGVHFVNGEATIHGKSILLEKYYGVTYTNPVVVKEEIPDGLQVKEETKEEVNSEYTVDEDAYELSRLIAERKQGLEVSPENITADVLAKFEELKTWGEKRSYVREVTGVLPKDKAQALQLLGVE